MIAMLRPGLVLLAASLGAGAAFAQAGAPATGGAQPPARTWSWPPQGSVWPTQPAPQETVAPEASPTPITSGETVPGVVPPSRAPAPEVPTSPSPINVLPAPR